MEYRFADVHSPTKKRQVMMILGMLMIPLVLSTSFIFIDSYSLLIWQRETSVGPASIVITGSDAYTFSSRIENLDGINHSAYVQNAWASIVSLSNNTIPTTPFSISGYAPAPESPPYVNLTAGALSSDFAIEFPTIFQIINGRHPNNTTEISLLASVANQLGVSVGDSLRYANTSGVPGPGGALFRYEVELDIVGIYTHSERIDSNPLPYTRGDIIVVHDLIGLISPQSWVYVDVDDSLINPAFPENSIDALRRIDQEIKHLDPEYSETVYWSRFYLQDLLASGILDYIEWHADQRVTRIVDSIGLIFVSLISSYLFVGRYVSKRESEYDLLQSRGASLNASYVFLARELAFASTIGIGLGIGFGFVLSQLGLLSYIQNLGLQQIPFLLKLDALLAIALLSLICPQIFLLIQIKLIQKPKDVTHEAGKLKKLSRFLALLRLDFGVTIIILLVIITISQIRLISPGSPFVAELTVIMPLVFFLALTNIIRKIAPRGSRLLSRIIEPIVGKCYSRLGVRNLGNGKNQLVISVMVIALVSTMLWTSSVIEYNSASSYLSQMRFSISGDVTFKLDPVEFDSWPSFRENVSLQFPSAESTFLTKQILFLSSGLEGEASFHAINPVEYARVAYDYNGIPLEDSILAPLLFELEANITGAVVTRDVADEFQLSIGGPLRGFLSNGTDYEVLVFSVLGIVDYLPDVLVQSNGYMSPTSVSYPSLVGVGKVWVNREYALNLLSEEEASANYLCLRTNDYNLIPEQMNELRNDGGEIAIDRNGVGISYQMADDLFSSEPFHLNSNFKHLIDIQLTASLFLILIPLIDSLIENDKRIHFLLQSIGYDSEKRRKIAGSKSLALFLSTLFVVLALFPIFMLSISSFYIETFEDYVGRFPSILIISDYFYPWLLLFPLLLTVFVLLLPLLVKSEKNVSSFPSDISIGSRRYREVFL